MKKSKRIVCSGMIIVAIAMPFVYSMARYCFYSYVQTNGTTKKLLDAMDAHDRKAIKGLFSNNVLKQLNQGEFEEGLSFFLASYEGERTDVFDGGCVFEHGFYGPFSWEAEQGHGLFVTYGEKEYYLTYDFTASLKEADTGIYSLGIIESNSKQATAINSGRCGVYNPTWDAEARPEDLKTLIQFDDD